MSVFAKQQNTKAKAAASPVKQAASDVDGGDGGGVMTCANRGLLQQMLAAGGVSDGGSDGGSPERSADDQENGLSMSVRLIPGTPAAGTQARNVPTITSPAAIRAKPSVMSGHPVVRQAAVPPARAQGAPPQQVVTTGPPQAHQVVQARPGSRGGLTPQSFSTPSHRPGLVSGGAARAPGSYAGMHALRSAKVQSPAGSGVKASGKAQPAAKPMCGPSAFAMLAQMQAKAQPGDCESPMAGVTTTERLNCEQSEDEADDDPNGFIMPDSDGEGSYGAGDLTSLPQSQPQPQTFPLQHPVPQQPQPSPPPQPQQVQRQPQPRGQQHMQGPYPSPPEARGGSGPGARAAPLQPGALPVSDQSLPRARSSDPKVAPLVVPSSAGSAMPRVRSCDPRPAVAEARMSRSDDDDSSDDDGPTGAHGGAGIPTQWKADVRSMVKDFAQEERARGRAAGGDAINDSTQRKPPRAPPQQRKPLTEVAPPAEEPPQKKAPVRKVDYNPATVEDYKQRYGPKGELVEAGHLGPDLDDEGLLMKKAMQEKVKQFSKELGRINKVRSEQNPVKPKPKSKAEPSARDKMKEFAKNVPKPKAESRPAVVVDQQTPPRPQAKCTQEPEGLDDWEEIRRREVQHFEQVAKVEDIKAFMSRLAV